MVGSAPVINRKKKNLWLRVKKYWDSIYCSCP